MIDSVIAYSNIKTCVCIDIYITYVYIHIYLFRILSAVNNRNPNSNMA